MSVDLASFAVTAVVLIILPGPDSTVVLNSIVRAGRRGGLQTAAGICVGLLFWLTVAVAGLSALLAASRTGYDALKFAGALYLGYLGVRALLARRRSGSEQPAKNATKPTAASSATGRGWFLRGVTTDILNPKVGVLFVTFIPQFIPAGAPVTAMTFLFGGFFIVGTAAWFLSLIRLARYVTKWLERPRVQQWLERITGAILLGFAASLVAETR